jgi:aryl-alcohol dehydrogenase-like predicted oxidoreductase
MQTTKLGRTNLTVSVAGLGCGGHSRLGLGTGGSEDSAIRIIHAAMDDGVNFIDTAQNYGTEEVVGKAVENRRDQVVLSTKVRIIKPGARQMGDDYISGDLLAANFETSLKRLRTDYVDILHLHGITPSQYAYCEKELVPALYRLREQGKIRFLGLTERFILDPQHAMLTQALKDDCWDVIMAGFNLINPSARKHVFRHTLEKNIGILNMFAVRRALSNADALREIIEGLVEDGLVDGDKIDAEDPLGFLTRNGVAASVVEAAYRFCRHEPGSDIILTGTGNLDHLRENLSSIQKPPLPESCLQRLQDIFGNVDSVSGN